MSVTAPEPASELMGRRVARFEARLFHGTLLARAAFPAIALLTLLGSAFTGERDPWVLVVWVALTAWTAVTLPLAWSRLDWSRRLPPVVRAEMVVFAGLAFLGLGSRSWHVLHAYVPLAFCAYFVSERAGKVMAAAIIGGLWGSHMVVAIWPEAPIDEPIAAVTPTALAVTGALLLAYVRRLVDHLRAVIDAERRFAGALARARDERAALDARRMVQRDVSARLSRLSGHLSVPHEWIDAADTNRATVGVLVADIRRAIRRLQEEPAEPDAATFRESVLVAIDDTAPLGGTATLSVESPHADAQVPGDQGAWRRALTEAVTNARKHGDGAVVVSILDGDGRVRVRIDNAAAAPPEMRQGGIGLSALHEDAEAGAFDLHVEHADGRVSVYLTAPGASAGQGASDAPPEEDDTLRDVNLRSRISYERGVLVARLFFACLAAVMIHVKADQHVTIFPLLVTTSVVLVTWNALLLIAWRRARTFALHRPGLVWVEGLAMVGIVAVQGGMSTPWIPTSMGSILTVVLFVSARRGVILVGFLGGALLIGYWLMRALPVDDAGTQAQDMPFGWVLNMASYAVVLGIAVGIRWVFNRADEAIATFEQTRRLQSEAARENAWRTARAETRRELHAHLQQSVAAARLRLGMEMGSGQDTPTLRRLEQSLTGIWEALGIVMRDLSRPVRREDPRVERRPDA